MAPELSPLENITSFLTGIGLPVRHATSIDSSVLPGLGIDRGVLVVAPDQLEHPGDLLHEAGHLAVLPAAGRSASTTDVGSDGGYEMAAIAWSWAALRHLNLDPAVVFHEGGYQGGGQALIENFEAGRYFGVPMLQWLGLTADSTRAAELGVDPYPAMIRWLAE
jgi:hypothetical protein